MEKSNKKREQRLRKAERERERRAELSKLLGHSGTTTYDSVQQSVLDLYDTILERFGELSEIMHEYHESVKARNDHQRGIQDIDPNSNENIEKIRISNTLIDHFKFEIDDTKLYLSTKFVDIIKSDLAEFQNSILEDEQERLDDELSENDFGFGELDDDD